MRSPLLLTATVLACALTPSFVQETGGTPPRRVGGGTNSPPVCVINTPLIVECQGDTTVVVLDASGSFDADGDALNYVWQVSPNASLDDNNLIMPTLTIDTSSGCETNVGIRLRVGDGQYSSFCRIIMTVVAPSDPLVLELDIKPGSCPNPINTGAGGVVPVSVLGTASFDVALVNLATVRLGRVDGTGGTIAPTGTIAYEDTGTPFADDGCDCHAATGDGITDLSLKFAKPALVATLLLESEPPSSYLPLQLTGELIDGTPFVAYDCIRVQ